MEKDGFMGGNGFPSLEEMSSNAQLLMNGGNACFLNLNWEQQQSSTDVQTSNFESALSSLVSSPTSSSINLPPAAAGADNMVIRELIGRLGTICNNNSPDNYQSANTSCHTTPLNSPPKLNLSMMMDHHNSTPPPATQFPFSADPGFAERAARYSCFGGAAAAARNYAQLGLLQDNGKLSRVSSNHSLNANVMPGTAMQLQMQMQMQMQGDQIQQQHLNTMMMRSPQEEISSAVNNVTRKRKSAATTPSSSSSSKGSKGKDATLKASEDEKLNSKRCKAAAAAETAAAVKVENNNESAAATAAAKTDDKQSKDPAEPPKQDYIHVRARRGQATDSHSLAERVRREKISERMKFLQDLVPGCNKVTGKAVMLDEIINYVQSLQRQVEFLSMKLATVNPRVDINVDSLLPKDIHQAHGPMPPHSSSYPMEATSIAAFSYANQPHEQGQNHHLQSLMETQLLDAGLRRSLSMQLPSLDGFTDASAASQLGAFWEDDLQSVVQMGFGANQEAIFSSQSFQGPLPTSNMKIEL